MVCLEISERKGSFALIEREREGRVGVLRDSPFVDEGIKTTTGEAREW
jgi:hypothetical protein